jgi:hypothetical protein
MKQVRRERLRAAQSRWVLSDLWLHFHSYISRVSIIRTNSGFHSNPVVRNCLCIYMHVCNAANESEECAPMETGIKLEAVDVI